MDVRNRDLGLGRLDNALIGRVEADPLTVVLCLGDRTEPLQRRVLTALLLPYVWMILYFR